MGVGHNLTALWKHRLHAIVFRHLSVAACKHRHNFIERLLIQFQRQLERVGHGLTRQIIERWS